jgi:hypothetical protein
VTGNYDSQAIRELETELCNLQVFKDPALQAYLSLPTVNAMSGDIMEGFHNDFVATYVDLEAAITAMCELDEKESEIAEFASDRHFSFDALAPDYVEYKRRAEEVADFVERGGRVHVFYK